MSGHGGGDDEAAGTTLLEVCSDGLCAVEGSIEISLNNLVPGLDRAVKDATVCGPAGVGNEGIDLAELLDDVAD